MLFHFSQIRNSNIKFQQKNKKQKTKNKKHNSMNSDRSYLIAMMTYFTGENIGPYAWVLTYHGINNDNPVSIQNAEPIQIPGYKIQKILFAFCISM